MNMRSFTLKPIALALLAATVVSAPVFADSGIKEDVTLVPGRQISPRDETVISGAAVKVLRHIAAARGDLRGDKADLKKAKADLAKGDSKAANERLSSAERNLVFISISYQSPLTQAKVNLWRASLAYVEDDFDSAKLSLDNAVKQLEKAARDGDQVTREAAAKLVDEVRNLHQMIETGDKGLAGRLEGVWHRTEALSERSIEYLSTGWQRLRAEGPGKKDLIEAKLQLSYARIDHFSTKDDAAAKVDLAEAKGYLDTAAKQVDSQLKPQLDEVSNLVGKIESSLQQAAKDYNNRLAFEKAESQLARLIRQI